MELRKLCTMYIEKDALTPGADKPDRGLISGSHIRFGPPIEGKEIQCVELKSGLLVADRCVTVSETWNMLNTHGLIYGRHTVIDGVHYLVRSLRVGQRDQKKNEWDMALDETIEDNALWHWMGTCFWGQDADTKNMNLKMIRGNTNPRDWSSMHMAMFNRGVGFRPAFEPLPATGLDPSLFLGTQTHIFTDNWNIECQVVGYDDYDVEISGISNSSKNVLELDGFIHYGNRSFVKRDRITWMEKPKKEKKK